MGDKILVTGAGGWLASALISEMEKCGKEIIAVTSDTNKIKDLYSDRVIICSNEEVLNGEADISEAKIAIHTAFCRRDNGSDLAKSLEFTKKILTKMMQAGVKGCINISSQAVYGSDERILPSENDSVNPSYLYAMAKYSEELLVEQIFYERDYVNLRVASIIGVWKGVPNNVISKMIRQSLNNEKLRIIGGEQKFSFIDIHDVVEAVLKLCDSFSKWKNVLNLGPMQQTGLLELTEIISKEIKKRGFEFKGSEIQPQSVSLNAGMNSQRLYDLIDWNPKYSIDRIINEETDYILNHDF